VGWAKYRLSELAVVGQASRYQKPPMMLALLELS
jgi:hypothetical protein